MKEIDFTKNDSFSLEELNMEVKKSNIKNNFNKLSTSKGHKKI